MGFGTREVGLPSRLFMARGLTSVCLSAIELRVPQNVVALTESST